MLNLEIETHITYHTCLVSVGLDHTENITIMVWLGNIANNKYRTRIIVKSWRSVEQPMKYWIRWTRYTQTYTHITNMCTKGVEKHKTRTYVQGTSRIHITHNAHVFKATHNENKDNQHVHFHKVEIYKTKNIINTLNTQT